ncbi:TIR domain-containing protein [Pseudomonas frederiksbergensis]|uniref:TIR domain-containing protein n=1 Tax=Pseudomonas frederiksbergensis TaxID=104087 RepID=A0A1H4ZE28_9PSED|nr:toll/interleukin-1 receptor domain-containing protein [Pseudomonas frederiksbergensis]SED28496.1 TIR domain-containing protein [Pseudomonas frederiksbergensis]
MKVFVSWSGQRSKAVAELISDWIKCVLQASQPWISTRDIDKGAIWFSEIADQLKDTAAGIVCLTQENKNKPWILFETGALAKGLSTNRVCTFLIDLESSEIEDPLAQFNHTFPEKVSMWGLISSLNTCLDSNKLEERVLRQVFDTYWPQFESKFQLALDLNPLGVEVVPRSEESMLAEILANTRSLSNRIRDLESRVVSSEDRVPEFNFDEKASYLKALIEQSVPVEKIISVADQLNFPRENLDLLLRKFRKGTVLKSSLSHGVQVGPITAA